MLGDGANDIPMMECAHVGVGIAGREGLAASRASDYSVAQFRFLQPLLFVHGRYSYQRTALFTLGTFYKSVIFYTCQFWFQIWTGWSGTSLFEQWTLSLYNILFASLPVLVNGVMEKDLNVSTLLGVPELYRSGQSNLHFNLPIFLRWYVVLYLF
jgi:magnesium-transporting ATPase (P-type)